MMSSEAFLESAGRPTLVKPTDQMEFLTVQKVYMTLTMPNRQQRLRARDVTMEEMKELILTGLKSVFVVRLRAPPSMMLSSLEQDPISPRASDGQA
jgi:hypothetical protein